MNTHRQCEIIRQTFVEEMAAIDRQGANKDGQDPARRLAHSLVKSAARHNSPVPRSDSASEHEALLARTPSSAGLLQRPQSSSAKTPTFDQQIVEGLAHDIKNPLVIINVHAQLLASQFGRDADESQRQELLIGIQDNVKRVLRLVEAFLDAAAIDKGKAVIVRQPVDINRLMRDAAQQQIELIRGKKIALRLNLDDRLLEITGDEFQLDRVFANLLGNAVKFTPTGGAIAMSSRVENGQVCVEIENTGAGIAKAELESIFDEFHRGASAHGSAGNGLGLYIVKTIVAAHHGTVKVTSEPGAGATFTLCFPVCE